MPNVQSQFQLASIASVLPSSPIVDASVTMSGLFGQRAPVRVNYSEPFPRLSEAKLQSRLKQITKSGVRNFELFMGDVDEFIEFHIVQSSRVKETYRAFYVDIAVKWDLSKSPNWIQFVCEQIRTTFGLRQMYFAPDSINAGFHPVTNRANTQTPNNSRAFLRCLDEIVSVRGNALGRQRGYDLYWLTWFESNLYEFLVEAWPPALDDVGVIRFADPQNGGWIQLCELPEGLTPALGDQAGRLLDPLMIAAARRYPVEQPAGAVPLAKAPQTRRFKGVAGEVPPISLASDLQGDCSFVIEVDDLSATTPLRGAVEKWLDVVMAPEVESPIHQFDFNPRDDPYLLTWNVDLGSFDWELRLDDLEALRALLEEAAREGRFSVRSARFVSAN